jgi:hypothetical protein
MIYLIWGIFNLGLFFYFIYICFKVPKLIKEKIGLFAAIFFVLGLLSFISQPENERFGSKLENGQKNEWKFNETDSLEGYVKYLRSIPLEETLISNFTIGIGYGISKHSKLNIPISANSSMTGFISGIKWNPMVVIIKTTLDNNRFQYFVDGTIEWKLLGATIYTQLKTYNGYVAIK